MKTDFKYEAYLDMISNSQYRYLLTQMRISAHRLRIETDRYGRNRIIQSDRVCVYCNYNEIDDEFHFILVCDIHLLNRQKYINKKY